MKKYYSISFFLISVLLLNIQSVVGQNMLVWNFRTPTVSTGTEATFNATYYQNLELSTLTRGAGAPAAGGCGYGFVGNFGISADKATAIANNAYFEFKVQAKDSCLMYLKKIKAIIRIQTYSAKSYQWMYSIDGLNFVDIGSPITPDVSEIDVNNGVMQPDIDLSGISALQELSSFSRVTFRLYAWGGSTPGEVNPTWFNFGLGKTTTTIPSLAIEGYSVKNDKTLAWNFYGSDGKATSFYATSKDNKLEISNLKRGAGSPGINGNSNGFTAALTVSASAEEAETNNAYFEFDVKPKSGSTVSLSNISANIRTQTYSAKTYQWKYSLNGASFVNIGSAVTVPVEEVNVGNGVIQPLIDLTGITDLQNIPSTSTVVFRLYAWGGSTPAVDAADKTSVNFGFGKSTSTVPSLMINGAVSGESQSMNKIITAWEFSTIGNTSTLNPSPVTGSFNATTLNTNINTGVLSRGSGLNSAVGLYYSYAGASVLLSTTKGEAVTNNEYFQVILSPKSQCKLSVAGLRFKYRTTSTGHKNYCWKYSTDGINFTEFANGVFTSTDTYGEIQHPVDVSAISGLQNIESNVTFRIYVWGATSTSAANAIGRFAAGDTSNSLMIYGKTIDLASFNIANSTNASTLESCPTCDVTVSSVGELNIDATKTFNSVTVAAGGKLTNTQGSVLSTNTLNLNSDATGTATFIDNGTTNITAANVQQYLNTARNWYISSPVALATVPSNIAFYSYDESGSNTGYTAPATANWVSAPQGSSIIVGKGYIAQPVGATTFTFSGALNNSSSYSIPVTRSVVPSKSGFNLVGNPYPAYIDWSLVIADAENANIGTTMWYRTKNTGDIYTFATHNGTSGVTVTGTANTTITRFIPPMQSFWILVNNGVSSTNLKIKKTMLDHRDVIGNTMKAPKSANNPLLRLQVSNGTNTDEAVVYFNANASNAFDAYDSPKMSNANKAIPEIYTLAANEELVINGMNELPLNTELPLGFRTGEFNNYSIKTSEFTNFDSNVRVFLKDKAQSTEIDITDEAVYNFSSDVANTENRFSIILRTAGMTTYIPDFDNQAISIFGNADKKITIRCSSELIGGGTVSVYDEVGQKLEHKSITGSTTVLNSTYSSGVYLVCVKANGKTKTQRVIIN